MKNYGCTNVDGLGKFWCSTQPNPETGENLSGPGFWGFCEEENCPKQWIGKKMEFKNAIPIKIRNDLKACSQVIVHNNKGN